jgi:outer membrane protein assembly factor BamB
MRTGNRGLRVVLFVGCGLFAVAGPLANAANWARFRGPNGTGMADDKDIPVQWTEKNIRWKAPIPGAGNSSPVIWGDKLFIESADAKNRMLFCINVKDGKTIWMKNVDGQQAKINGHNSLASSTPATDGQRVYAYFWDGKDIAVHAFDMQGNPVWKYDLGPWAGNHGAGASPVVYEDKVIILNDQGSEFGDPGAKSELVAIDAKSGKEAWKVKRKAFRACYAAPFLLDKREGGKELIVATTEGLSGYDPQNGKEFWRWDWVFDAMALRTVGSPIAGDGLVFAGSGDGSGARHMVAVRLGGKGDVSKTHLAWEEKKSLPYVPGMLYSQGHLYTVNDSGRAACYVGQTGKELWKETLPGAKGLMASPILVDGKIYAITTDGKVFVFAAATSYKLLAQNSIGEAVYASPAVADGRLFIRGKNHLYCIGNK